MRLGRRLKHLPENQWPAEDRRLFQTTFAPGDIFDDERGAGAHLSTATRETIRFAWRRWLGFLVALHPEDLRLPAADRITPERVRAYVEHLGESMKAISVAAMVAHLYDGARLIAPEREWSWLKALKTRLQARGSPEDRFERLVPAHQTLDLGLALMDEALMMPLSGRNERDIQYRDGLILAVLSLWPIRRRSIAALTLGRHVKIDEDHIELRLFPEDTKSKRMESWPVPEALLPYFRRYVNEIRPRLVDRFTNDSFWLSSRGKPLRGDGLYNAVCKRTEAKFGRPMALHDFRRAAATFLAMEAPEKVGLTPGILQHVTPDTGDRHYNLSRSMLASRRHVGTLTAVRARLRSTTGN